MPRPVRRHRHYGVAGHAPVQGAAPVASEWPLLDRGSLGPLQESGARRLTVPQFRNRQVPRRLLQGASMLPRRYDLLQRLIHPHAETQWERQHAHPHNHLVRPKRSSHRSLCRCRDAPRHGHRPRCPRPENGRPPLTSTTTPRPAQRLPRGLHFANRLHEDSGRGIKIPSSQWSSARADPVSPATQVKPTLRVTVSSLSPNSASPTPDRDNFPSREFVWRVFLQPEEPNHVYPCPTRDLTRAHAVPCPGEACHLGLPSCTRVHQP